MHTHAHALILTHYKVMSHVGLQDTAVLPPAASL